MDEEVIILAETAPGIVPGCWAAWNLKQSVAGWKLLRRSAVPESVLGFDECQT